MPTPQQATDTVYGAFNTAWAVNSTYPVVWPNKKPDTEPMKQGNPWAFVRIAHKTGRQVSLPGVDGKRIWERKGQLVCEIYTPSGEGTQAAYTLARLVELAFLGKTIHLAVGKTVVAGKTIDSVRFRAIQIKEGGIHGNWFLVTVTAEFEYDEIV